MALEAHAPSSSSRLSALRNASSAASSAVPPARDRCVEPADAVAADVAADRAPAARSRAISSPPRTANRRERAAALARSANRRSRCRRESEARAIAEVARGVVLASSGRPTAVASPRRIALTAAIIAPPASDGGHRHAHRHHRRRRLSRHAPRPRAARARHADRARGTSAPIREIVLLDIAAAADFGDPRVRRSPAISPIRRSSSARSTPDTEAVFHLAAVVSGQAEADFDSACASTSTRRALLLERCRKLAAPPKFVFTSSLAVFGGPLPDPVPDDAPLTPQSSYGTQKAIGEYLVYDMTRKGFIDGRSLRLPTVTVRPGKPNKAASSFASGIIREPLAGVDATVPGRAGDADVGHVAARGRSPT